MNPSVCRRVLTATKSEVITGTEVIQPLWNHYGLLSRIFLEGGSYSSVILKHIQIPSHGQHPKGFATGLSQQRKLRSYQVEQVWYQHYNQKLLTTPLHPSLAAPICRTPQCIDTFHIDDEIFLLLEDLTTCGFVPQSSLTTWGQVESVLEWLAHFHAHFLHCQESEGDNALRAEGLWETGSYWHLATRPDEWSKIRGSTLHWVAPLIDSRLSSTSFQTIIHGDAKLANFCFHDTELAVAAVDFQYVGRGCGMRDLAYFVGSIFGETESERYETMILDHYFSYLRTSLEGSHHDQTMMIQRIEEEWRELYPVCWADFQRFLLGWSPQHYKHNSYTNTTTAKVIDTILNELLETATTACVEAGKYLLSRWKSPIKTSSKGHDSLAADLVTDVDMKAQEMILKSLSTSINRYQLGVLTEESDDDKSRLEKQAFWAIDPLDGTRYFVQGESGFAVSIALVNQQGIPLIGVVYDPVQSCLYHAVKGRGMYKDGELWTQFTTEMPLTRYADLSLSEHPQIEQMKTHYQVEYYGGAVLNIVQVINQSDSFYAKRTRTSKGGCAIWDLAAVSLMLSEAGGSSYFYDGSPLHLNRPNSPYFHDVGLLFLNRSLDRDHLMTHVLI